MKIALLTTYDFATPGGVRNHMLQLSEALIAMGHECFILAPCSRVLDQPNLIQIAQFPSAAKTGFIPPHLLFGVKSVIRLHRVLNRTNFDIIHIHEPLLPPLCLSVLFHKKTPLLATFHTYYEFGQPLYRIFRPLFNQCLKRLKGRIAVSPSAKNYIAQYFPYPYQIIPNGIHVRVFSNPPRLMQVLHDRTHLLFVGHAQFQRKGLRYMLDAYHILKKDYPQLRLTIVGATWPGREKRISNPSYETDITYLGTVNNDTLIKLYQTADIFCAPSTGNESFGIVLLEAMAAGIPIVASHIDGYAHVVRHGQEAVLVPPKNSLALAEGIQYLIKNPEIRQKLVIAGQERVKRYDWSILAKQIVNYYNLALASDDSG